MRTETRQPGIVRIAIAVAESDRAGAVGVPVPVRTGAPPIWWCEPNRLWPVIRRLRRRR